MENKKISYFIQGRYLKIYGEYREYLKIYGEYREYRGYLKIYGRYRRYGKYGEYLIFLSG